MREVLSSPRHLAEHVDIGGIRQLLARHDAGERTQALDNMLFRLAIYETWARQFLESGSFLSAQQNRSHKGL